jgi:hypothetical protein
MLALADARDKKLRYIQTRNDLEFAVRNHSFFKELPADDVLTNAASIYTKLINAVLAHAIKLSRGQMTPPRLFDPTDLVPPIQEPAQILLQRASVLALPNAMPLLVGKPAEPLISLLDCIQLEGVEHCLAFLGGNLNGLGDDVRPLADFFFVVLRSGARPEVRGDVNRPGATVRAQFPAAGVEVPPGAVFQIDV